MLLNDPEMAKDHLLTVIRMARGTAIAQKADQMLLTLPEHLIAPPINETKHGNAQLVSISAAKANDKPSVLIFCAPWIQSCKTILDELRTALGDKEDKVNIVYIDADKKENENLLEEYGVKPLPAVLYLNSKNQVLLYTLGSPNLAVWQSRVRQLLDAEAKLKATEP
jgi:thiol-disulfide isomerase/thioredoxin